MCYDTSKEWTMKIQRQFFLTKIMLLLITMIKNHDYLQIWLLLDPVFSLLCRGEKGSILEAILNQITFTHFSHWKVLPISSRVSITTVVLTSFLFFLSDYPSPSPQKEVVTEIRSLLAFYTRYKKYMIMVAKDSNPPPSYVVIERSIKKLFHVVKSLLRDPCLFDRFRFLLASGSFHSKI